MEKSPQKIRHTTNVTENFSVSIGQTFATVPMRKIRHTTMIDWGWVGRVGVRGVRSGGVGAGGVEVTGGVRLGVWVGGLGLEEPWEEVPYGRCVGR